MFCLRSLNASSVYFFIYDMTETPNKHGMKKLSYKDDFTGVGFFYAGGGLKDPSISVSPPPQFWRKQVMPP